MPEGLGAKVVGAVKLAETASEIDTWATSPEWHWRWRSALVNRHALTTEGASIRRPSGAALRFSRPLPGGVLLLSEAAHV
jgi:hypothetical protein